MATRLRCRCVHCGHGIPLDPGSRPTSLSCAGCGAVFRVENGIVELTAGTREQDYPEPLIELVSNVEKRHFWFASRNGVIVSTLRSVVGPLSGRNVLDVGCGTGFVMAALEAAGLNAVGTDMHRSGLTRAAGRVTGPLVLSDATTLPFLADFDIVTLCDVIEHVDDDVAVLRQAARTLRPGGHVLVTVPADSRLWTKYDEVIGHKRRYDRTGLRTALEDAGLEVRYAGYFNCLPFVVQLAQRRLASGGNGERDALTIVAKALQVPPAPINVLLRLSVELEAPIRRLEWVRGGSLIAIARHPGS